VNVGGLVQDGVRKDTKFLVVAGEDYDIAVRTGRMSNKLKKAKSMLEGGSPIEIVSEQEFYRLL
jgi:hypothetical protein